MAEDHRHDHDCRELEERLERLQRSTARRFAADRRRIRTLELEVAGLEPGPATHATLTIQGDHMAGLSIDSVATSAASAGVITVSQRSRA